MKRRSVRSMLGWLLLAVCAALLTGLALPVHVPETTAYTPAGHAAEVAALPAFTGLLDVNRADAVALTALPGVGESMAQAIVEERERNGPFFYPEDLCAVRGIGPAKVNGFRMLLKLEESDHEVESR